MDLRSGKPVWLLDHPKVDRYPPLSQDVECEIAIIGGGITGALALYELTKAGLNCVLLDRRDPGRGSTWASTALLLYELDATMSDLTAKIGENQRHSRTQRCWRPGRKPVLSTFRWPAFSAGAA